MIVYSAHHNIIFVFGNNKNGQLGLGDFENKNTYTKLDLQFGIFDKKPIKHNLGLNLDEIII